MAVALLVILTIVVVGLSKMRKPLARNRARILRQHRRDRSRQFVALIYKNSPLVERQLLKRFGYLRFNLALIRLRGPAGRNARRPARKSLHRQLAHLAAVELD